MRKDFKQAQATSELIKIIDKFFTYLLFTSSRKALPTTLYNSLKGFYLMLIKSMGSLLSFYCQYFLLHKL